MAIFFKIKKQKKWLLTPNFFKSQKRKRPLRSTFFQLHFQPTLPPALRHIIALLEL
jgi:hypothetical protein